MANKLGTVTITINAVFEIVYTSVLAAHLD